MFTHSSSQDRDDPLSSLINTNFNIEKNFLLILTATISVDNIPRVYPPEKSVRQEQYIKTLNYYLQNHPQVQKIIFIENSASPLEPLKEAAQDNPYQKQIEFISLDTNLTHGHMGKGFGECLLIQQGLKQSELIKTVTHFGKITGRICLTNLTQILETLPPNFDCVCDYKDQGYKIKNFLLKKKQEPFLDTRFIAFSQKFYYDYLELLHIDFVEKFPKSYFCIEVELYKKIHPLESQNNIIKRFKIEPRFLGISGHSGGKKYGGKDYSSWHEEFKTRIRSLARHLVPYLHI